MPADSAVDQFLSRNLPALEDLATDICRDADLLDPDAFEARFDSACAPVTSALAQLMADPEDERHGDELLVDELRRAVDSVVAASNDPLSIDLEDRYDLEVRCGSVCPAMLERLIAIGARHAGLGGSVRASLDAAGRMVVVEVEASRAPAQADDPQTPPELRCASLVDFAESRACQLSWTENDGVLRLRLAALAD